LRVRTRERYRVYSQNELFAEDGFFAGGEPAAADERGPHDGESLGRTRARGARRAVGVAMLLGATGAVVAVLALDATRHAGGLHRRTALVRVAPETPRGSSASARSPSRSRLPRALARQSRRGGRQADRRQADPRRGRVRPARSQAPPERSQRDAGAVGRPAVVRTGRDEVARAYADVAESEAPARPRSEEFGFER
jgi:hypothetical protein